MSRIVYLLWSNKHNSWWAPNSRGYTDDMDEAGRYNEADAIQRVVQSAQSGIRSSVTYMVAAPDNWVPVGPDRVAEILTLLNGKDVQDPHHYVIRHLPELVDGSQRWLGGHIWGFDLVDGTSFRRGTADSPWSVIA